MIQITPQMRILVAVEAIDGRKGMDALAQLCREKLKEDPPLHWAPGSATGVRAGGAAGADTGFSTWSC